MAKKEFKAESKRLLEMMVNSIYSQKEIFVRELISNASDAIDKMYYKALTDDSISFNQDDFFIRVSSDKTARTLTIEDTGIGMTEDELERNLGTIAESGSLAFKKENEVKDGHDIIGQFGVGFYSAFMAADRVTVETKSIHSDQAFRWESDGVDGYTIDPSDKKASGTTITVHLKDNGEEDSYDEFLEENRLKTIIKKYSDFIRYPILMNVTVQKPKEDSEETEEVRKNRRSTAWSRSGAKTKPILQTKITVISIMKNITASTSRLNMCILMLTERSATARFYLFRKRLPSITTPVNLKRGLNFIQAVF
jgi:molecular chaperone HtpG